METTWQDPELRFLLGEIIKASSVDVSLVADFIRTHKISPNWLNMQLPIGRTMQQCMGAADRVLPVHPSNATNFYSLKRKSSGDTNEQPSKRPLTIAQVDPAHPPRNIQPRPISNGYAPAVSINSSPSVPSAGASTGTGTGKKRGRPSKADKEAQARANSFRTMEYALITPAPAPAPSASINLAPQREYASSPGYEVAGGTAEIKGKKRGNLGGIENSPTGSFYPLASPSSGKDIPRGGPEAVEQPSQTQSPREYGGGHPADPRSSSLHPPLRHPSPMHVQPQPQSLQQSNTLPPIQSNLRPSASAESYRPEHPRMLDPIFPDRDRSRSAFDQISRSTPPAPPVANRG